MATPAALYTYCGLPAFAFALLGGQRGNQSSVSAARALVIVSATARAWVTPRVLHRRQLAAGRRSYTGSTVWGGRNDDQGL